MKSIYVHLIDVEKVQKLTDLFFSATNVPASVFDLNGSVIVSSGDQGICSIFHKSHPESYRHCMENSRLIADRIAAGEKFVFRECKNGLINAASPIIVHGEHIANVFTGQFLFAPPDRDFFKHQAAYFGFDDAEYLDALSGIPVVDRSKIESFLRCFTEFSEMLGETGFRQSDHSKMAEIQERYDLLSRHNRDIVLIIRKEDGHIVDANSAAIQSYGYMKKELLNLAIRDLRPSGTVLKKGTHRKRIVDKPPGPVETVHIRKDGSLFPVEVSSHDDNESGSGTSLLIIHDITRQKQMEKALQKAYDDLDVIVEERTAELREAYRLVEAEMIERRQAESAMRETNELLKLYAVQSSRKEYLEAVTSLLQEWTFCEALGIRILDDKDIIPYESSIGFSTEFQESESCLSLVCDECICPRIIRGVSGEYDKPYLTANGSFHCPDTGQLARQLAQGSAVSRTDTSRSGFRGKCIEEGYKSIAIIPIFYRNQILGAIHLADRKVGKITRKTVALIESIEPIIGEAVHRFHLEEEQRKLQEQLLQAQKMEALGTATGGIAHDFNNILAAIIGFTEVVRGRTPEGTKEAKLLGRVVEAGLRGRSLIRQMMTFARKTGFEKRPINLSDVIAETMGLLRASIPTTIAMSVKHTCESSLIQGDASQIQQVLMNLCSNAAYAMREKGGIIEFQLSDFIATQKDPKPSNIKPGQYIALTIRDTGEGILPEHISKIFDPFFTTKSVGQGTGLGLSVVHGIVSLHSGYNTVESVPGKETLFTIYFPKISGKISDDAESDKELPTGHERVLFVDDEEAIIEMGREILEELGYQVTVARDGRQALQTFRVNPSQFDIVVTDQAMPNMTGTDLAKEVLALRQDIPIVICTGFSQILDGEAVKAAGIKALTLKPLTKGEIAKTIRSALDKSSITQFQPRHI
jgi:PAS domain S-box-containing protein